VGPIYTRIPAEIYGIHSSLE